MKKRFWEKLDELKLNPFPTDVKRIAGKKEKSFRVRVGDYRVQYYVFQTEKEIVAFKIEKRSKSY